MLREKGIGRDQFVLCGTAWWQKSSYPEEVQKRLRFLKSPPDSGHFHHEPGIFCLGISAPEVLKLVTKVQLSLKILKKYN